MTATMTPNPVRPNSQQFRQWLDELLTVTDLMRMFRKGELTIQMWVRRGLPTVRIRGAQRDTLRFERAEVLAWAKVKGKRLYLTD